MGQSLLTSSTMRSLVLVVVSYLLVIQSGDGVTNPLSRDTLQNLFKAAVERVMEETIVECQEDVAERRNQVQLSSKTDEHDHFHEHINDHKHQHNTEEHHHSAHKHSAVHKHIHVHDHNHDHTHHHKHNIDHKQIHDHKHAHDHKHKYHH